MSAKIFAGAIALVIAAILTLAIMIALVKGTILVVSIANLPLRILAACADIILGTILLVGCIYVATQLAVRISGVGNIPFPPLPESLDSHHAHSVGSPEN